MADIPSARSAQTWVHWLPNWILAAIAFGAVISAVASASQTYGLVGDDHRRLEALDVSSRAADNRLTARETHDADIDAHLKNIEEKLDVALGARAARRSHEG